MSCTVNIVDNRWKILHRSAQAVGQDRTTNHRSSTTEASAGDCWAAVYRWQDWCCIWCGRIQNPGPPSPRILLRWLSVYPEGPVLSVYHPIRSHLWGVLLKNDEMAIPVAAHHLWLSLPQRPLVLFSRQTVSSVCPLHRRADWNSSGSGGVLDIRSACGCCCRWCWMAEYSG